MAVSVNKLQMLSLYKTMLREAQKFPNYNYRLYALRRIRDAFKENKSVNDAKAATQLKKIAHENLEIIKRQAIIGNMFRIEKLVIENQNSSKC